MKKKGLLAAVILCISLAAIGCGRSKDIDGEVRKEQNVDIKTFDEVEDDRQEEIMSMPVTFVNNTGVDIYYLYASTADTDNWEEDILDVDVLSYGAYVRVQFSFLSTETVWDFAVEDIEGNMLEFYDLDFADYDKSGAAVVLNEDGTADITANANDFELPEIAVDYESLYSPALDDYYEALRSGWDYSDMENICSSDMLMPGYGQGLYDIGYALMDVDGNGVPELLIGSPDHYAGVFIAMYTLSEDLGRIREVAVSFERAYYYLCSNGGIGLRGSGGSQDYSYEFYELDERNAALRPAGALVHSGDGNGGQWFRDFECMQPISEYEAEQTINAYSPQSISFTMFSDYESQEQY